MSCNNISNCNNKKCGCDFNVKTVGLCDVSKLNIDGKVTSDLNWTEVSIPEILKIPPQKPDIEGIDQVYASICLEDVKLIETPYAYKRYPLYSFYTGVNALTGTLPGLLTTLTGKITAIITPQLDTVLINGLNALVVALTPLSSVTGVSALIDTVKSLIAQINSLISNLLTDVAAVSDAVYNLLMAIASIPFSSCLICTAIDLLKTSLNTLYALVNSIPTLLSDIVTDLNNAAKAIGSTAVSAVVAIAVGVINTVIGVLGGANGLVSAALASVTAILTALQPIDCVNNSILVLIPNEEGTILTGRKLVINGVLKQKVVYTAEVPEQSVHSACYSVPFISFIIPYAKFKNGSYHKDVDVWDAESGAKKTKSGFLVGCTEPVLDLREEFVIDSCIEDIFIYALNKREIFKNVTAFFKAYPKVTCK